MAVSPPISPTTTGELLTPTAYRAPPATTAASAQLRLRSIRHCDSPSRGRQSHPSPWVACHHAVPVRRCPWGPARELDDGSAESQVMKRASRTRSQPRNEVRAVSRLCCRTQSSHLTGASPFRGSRRKLVRLTMWVMPWRASWCCCLVVDHVLGDLARCRVQRRIRAADDQGRHQGSGAAFGQRGAVNAVSVSEEESDEAKKEVSTTKG